MRDIELERTLEAIFGRLFDDVDDPCPKAKSAYDLLDTMKQTNNKEILEQIGYLKVPPCNPDCPHKKRRKC